MMMKSRQQGLTLISTIIVAIFVVAAIILGFKVTPVYTEYFGVKRIIAQVADEAGGSGQEAEIRRSFERRSNIEQSISSVNSSNLVIRKVGGRTVIVAQWKRAVPLAGNASLVFDFLVDSSKK
jgi:hypothetical protein